MVYGERESAEVLKPWKCDSAFDGIKMSCFYVAILWFFLQFSSVDLTFPLSVGVNET